MTQPDEADSSLILAIQHDTCLVHVSSPKSIVDHFGPLPDGQANDTHPLVEPLDGEPQPGDLLFYTATGRRISWQQVRALAAGGSLSEGSDASDVRNQRELLERIHEGRRRTQAYLRQYPESGEQPGSEPITDVPPIADRYPQALSDLDRLFMLYPAHHVGLLHTLWHLANGT